jgi:hypothetical protein
MPSVPVTHFVGAKKPTKKAAKAAKAKKKSKKKGAC